MRPPGGMTTDMFNYANDIDIYREWAHVVVYNRFTAQYTRPYTAVMSAGNLESLCTLSGRRVTEFRILYCPP